MAKIGTIPAGGLAVITLDHLPESLYIQPVGALDSFEDVTSISVSQGGKQLVTLTDQQRIEAMAKIGLLSEGDQGSLRLALGRKNGSTTLQIQSSSASVTEVFAVSSGFSEFGYNYVEGSINPNANQSFSAFDAVVFTDFESIERVNITFIDEDGNQFSDDFSTSELRSLFSYQQNVDTNGTNANQLTIIGAGIKNIVVYNSGASSVVYAVRSIVKL
jgi:hypothetical protein